MVIYSMSENGVKVKAFNGITALSEALLDKESFDKEFFENAEQVALRSCELFIERIKDADSLLSILSRLPAQKDLGIKYYADPVDSFIGTEEIATRIKDKFGVDDSVVNDMLFVMVPAAFYGFMTEEALHDEIEAAYHIVTEEDNISD